MSLSPPLYKLELPDGFCATIFADGIGHARHLVVAPNGVVYVNTWSGRYYGNDTPHAGGFLVGRRVATQRISLSDATDGRRSAQHRAGVSAGGIYLKMMPACSCRSAICPTAVRARPVQQYRGGRAVSGAHRRPQLPALVRSGAHRYNRS